MNKPPLFPLCLALCASLSAAPEMKTEAFDKSPADWRGRGVSANWSDSGFAAGVNQGEAAIQPNGTNNRVIYADMDIHALNLDMPFEASGRVMWRINSNPNTHRGIHFGFFDSNSYSSVIGLGFHGNGNARAFMMDEPYKDEVAFVKQSGFGAIQTGGKDGTGDAKSYAFSIKWDPNGGSSAAGQLTVALEGLGEQSIELTKEERAAYLGSFDAFGFFVPNGKGANGAQFFADDLSYTLGSEALVMQMKRDALEIAKSRGKEIEAVSGGESIAKVEEFDEPRPVPGNMAKPDREYFFTPDLPLEDPDTIFMNFDTPSLSNHWMHIQAANSDFMDQGILNTEDIFLGGDGAVQSTAAVTYHGWTKEYHNPLLVHLNGKPILPDGMVADWFPDRIVRRAEQDGLEFVGTVHLAPQAHAVLKRLQIRNPGSEAKTFQIDFEFSPSSGAFGMAEKPDRVLKVGKRTFYEYKSITLQPGEAIQFGAVLTYRDSVNDLQNYVANFDETIEASATYWDELIDDAYTPGAGPWLSGGAPEFHTSSTDTQRLYHFGIMTCLMTMMNADDVRVPDSNLYIVALPEAPYNDQVVLWDNGYALPIMSMMDPAAAKNIILKCFEYGVHEGEPVYNGFPYATQSPFLHHHGGKSFSASASQLVIGLHNYIQITGDYALLDTEIRGRTILDWLREIDDFHNQRAQWNGIAHYGTEHNLFDPGTVKGYVNWVAAPNAAAVFIRNVLALYEERAGDSERAEELRASADKLAEDLIAALYNDAPGHEGTWKQRHEDGSFAQLRHGWDFMLTGSFIYDHLSDEQKEQMKDWLFTNIVHLNSGDIWTVTQDPRDGNNGTHQMEHNGAGAYPAWPYHFGWSLKMMGFEEEMVDLMNHIDGITKWGPLGQGSTPDGKRARGNWIDAAGTSMASYIVYLHFDMMSYGLDVDPQPQLHLVDKKAKLINLPYRGDLYTVDKKGMHKQ